MSLSNSYDVRPINVKVGIQCQKGRDGVMVNTSASNAGGPWLDSWLQGDQFLYVTFTCLSS